MHSINWIYTAIMFGAVATCSILLRRTQAKLPLSNTEKLGIAIGGFIGAMLGAKLPFLLVDWSSLFTGGAWLTDGKTIMCGIVGGYIGVEIAKWTMEISIKTGDSFAVPVAIAVGIGRIACFQGGCCYGTETDLAWGVCFSTAEDAGGIPRHPTQIYEAFFHFTLAGLLLAQMAWLKRSERRNVQDQERLLANEPSAISDTMEKIFHGQLIKFYIILYLVYRFFSEWLRPEPHLFAGLTAYQWASLVMLPIFILLWIHDVRHRFKRQIATAL